MHNGQIIKVTGGLYTVKTAEKLWQTKPRGVFRLENITPYVGDYVVIEPIEEDIHGEDTATIIEVKERKNYLIRPPVANLDHMVMVISTVEPLPNYVIIDKFLATMEYHDINTIIAITKPDIGSADKIKEIYEQAGYKVFVVDNSTGEGAGELIAELGESLTAFAGNSGTGKSSLLNTLHPSLELEVGETSRKLGRGRHTTRHVEIFELSDGLRIADTPGFSSMDLTQMSDVTSDGLDICFIDFLPYISNCKFNDCAHINETGCGIKQAVEKGEINTQRYESYRHLYNELKDVKEWER